MGLTLILQDSTHIAISGDSRGCLEENGIYYAIDDNTQKVQVIDNKIIFTSGSIWVLERVLNEYKNAENKSMDNLRDIGKRVLEEFEKLYPDDARTIQRKLELIVAVFENDKSVIYSISSFENFNILRVEGDSNYNTISQGTHRDKAVEYCKRLINKMPTMPMYEYIYDSVSDEQVGGMLKVYVLTKDGIIIDHNYKIKDSRPIRRYTSCDEMKSKSHHSGTTGITIEKNIGSSDNPVWEEQLFADTEGNLVLKGIVKARDFQDIQGNSMMTPDKTKIKGTVIEGKGLVINNGVTDTLKVDENGNVTLGGNITWNSKPTYSASEVGARPNTWVPSASEVGAVSNNQASVFNTLTNNGATQGLFMSGGQLYINADYINSGTINANRINTNGLGAEKIYKPGFPNTNITVGGEYGDLILKRGTNEVFKIYDGLNYTTMVLNGKNVLTVGLDGKVHAEGDWEFSGKINGYDLGDFAPKNHSHTEYASASHTHSSYAPVSHTHSGYASSTHDHGNYYAKSYYGSPIAMNWANYGGVNGCLEIWVNGVFKGKINL